MLSEKGLWLQSVLLSWSVCSTHQSPSITVRTQTLLDEISVLQQSHFLQCVCVYVFFTYLGSTNYSTLSPVT